MADLVTQPLMDGPHPQMSLKFHSCSLLVVARVEPVVLVRMKLAEVEQVD
jgi:hypothetical protein